MKVPLIPALALVFFVLYINGSRRETEFAVSDAQVEGYPGTSITESSQADDLHFAFRSARGDGITSGDVQVHGDLRPGSLDDADIHVTQQWRPHIGGWTEAVDAEHVVAQVEELKGGAMRVAYVAYFGDTTSRGAFVVAPKVLAK